MTLRYIDFAFGKVTDIVFGAGLQAVEYRVSGQEHGVTDANYEPILAAKHVAHAEVEAKPPVGFYVPGQAIPQFCHPSQMWMPQCRPERPVVPPRECDPLDIPGAVTPEPGTAFLLLGALSMLVMLRAFVAWRGNNK
jgi:hypothetical protein